MGGEAVIVDAGALAVTSHPLATDGDVGMDGIEVRVEGERVQAAAGGSWEPARPSRKRRGGGSREDGGASSSTPASSAVAAPLGELRECFICKKKRAVGHFFTLDRGQAKGQLSKVCRFCYAER